MKKGWWLVELKGYREQNHLATYYFFDYEKLPEIKQVINNSFEWLEKEPEQALSIGDEGTGERKIDYNKLQEFEIQIQVKLPASFLLFCKKKELQYKIRSCTDCYLDLADRTVKSKGKNDGFIVHFLSDSQWCFHWYLYVSKSGEEFVVVSPNAYGFNLDFEPEPDDKLFAHCHKNEIDFDNEEIWFCSPSFSEFIYRFWIENEIWFSLSYDKIPLTSLQQDYVNHYLLK